MKQKLIVAVMLTPLVLYNPSPAHAFECPKYLAKAQAAIDKASASINRKQGGFQLASRSHLRQAKMNVVEARHHHILSGNYHHARSIVRAQEALGHAITAYIMSQPSFRPGKANQ